VLIVPPRLSRTEARILELLAERGALYGLELVAASGGALKRGTVYVVLSRMQDKGYVSSRRGKPPPEGGLPRPRYEPTALGERALAAWRAAERAWQPVGEDA
jgi:DNA-binding PadR family transcriptional regulator